MKDYEKYVKALLLQVNKKGKEINYKTKLSYSKKFDAMLKECCLEIWNKRIVIDEETGEEKEKWYCVKKEFKGQRKYASMIKYLQKILNEK